LVTKDINLRLKAKSLNILSEDFETGKIKNIDNIYSGKKIFENIEKSVIDKLYETGYCLPSDIKWDNPISNQYLIIKNGKSSVLSYYNPLTKNIEKIDKYSAYRISPRNAEQVFALHAIMNQDIKVVTLQGVAGTGKTLLALAGAIEQKKEFKQIYVSRPMIPLSNKDYVGFLPGPIMEKINPYMEPLWDNLKFIQHQFKETDKEFKFISDAVQSEKIVVCPLSFIRGRSISNVLFIIDECLTKNHLVWTSDGKAYQFKI
jgi:PhoH-like ATPase